MRIVKTRSRQSFIRFSLTTQLIIVTVLLFFVISILNLIYGEAFLRFIAVTPTLVMQGRFWTLLTSMFAHAGLFHLFINMLSLFYLGSLTERIIGKKRFILFYLLAGVVGSAFYVAFAYLGTFTGLTSLFGDVNISAVGASGAIFGLLGILAVLLPHQRVSLITGPIVVLIIAALLPSFSIPDQVLTIAISLLNLLALFMVFSIFSANTLLRRLSLPMAMPLWVAPFVAIIPLMAIGYFIELPIGNTAHLGGLVVGLVYGLYLRLAYPRKVMLLNRMIRF